MKCKVCGSELAEGSLICKVCGSPIASDQARPSRIKEPLRPVEDVDFNWNTVDFPKPTKPEDIEMSWPQFNVHPKIDADAADEQIAASMASRRPVSIMRNDAQEGFVFTNAAPARPETVPIPVVQYVPVQAVPVSPMVPPQVPQYGQPQAQAPQYAQPQAQAPQYTQSQAPQYTQPQTPQFTMTQTGSFVPVWTMPAQQPMPAAEPLWYTQPMAAVTPQGIPVQYVPVYAQPAGPYTIAMQRSDGQIPGMPSREEFAATAPKDDDVPVDENWIKSQLSDDSAETSSASMSFTRKIDTNTEPFDAFAFDEPENVASKEGVVPEMPAAEAEPVPEVPVVEPVPEEPVAEPAPEEPVAEPAPEEPVAESAPEEPVAESVPEEPVAEPVAEPVPEESVAAPVAEPVLEAPAAEPECTAPATPMEEIIAEEHDATRHDRFYTFNKKNEEFQALLDAEYARVKAMRLGESAAAEVPAVEPVAPVAPVDAKVIDTSDISAAMAALDVDNTVIEDEPEDDSVITVEDIINASASSDPNATRIWNSEDEGSPNFKLPESMLSQPEEIHAEELSSFESMLMSGTRSRDEATEETIKISLSKVREAMVRPLAEDVTVPEFVDVEAEDRKKAEEEAAAAAAKAKELEEQRKAEESASEQVSLRKQRLEEMARAREEFFGPSLTPLTKATSEVGVIASRKEEPAEKPAEEPAAVKETAAPEVDSSEVQPVETSPEEEPAGEEKKEKKEKRKKAAEEDVSGYEEYTKKDYRRGGSKILIFLLVIVILALLLEGAKLMATRFMPDSTVTVFLTDLETDVVGAITKFFNTVVDGFNMLFKK